jgi:hypothetical protein
VLQVLNGLLGVSYVYCTKVTGIRYF